MAFTRFKRAKSTVDCDKRMNARFPSTCTTCGKHIFAGESIRFVRLAGKSTAYCLNCADQQAANRPAVPAESPSSLPETSRKPTENVPQGARPVYGTLQAPILGSDGWRRCAAESITELIDFAGSDFCADFDNRELADKYVTECGREAWYGGRTWESLAAALDDAGDTVGAAVDECRAELSDCVLSSQGVRRGRRIARRLDCGDDIPCPEDVFAGEVDVWSEVRRTRRPRRQLSIAVNVSCVCSKRAADLLWRGAAAVAIADIMTARGVAVEIVLFHSATQADEFGNGGKVVESVTIKRADRPLDVNAAALALSDVGFLRRIVFAAHVKQHNVKMNKGLGCTGGLPAADRAGFNLVLDESIETKSAALAAVRAAVGG